MASLNKCSFIGRLGQDPVLRQTQNNTSITTFSIAITDGKKGEEKTFWIKVSAWGNKAEPCSKILKKGHLVYVEGRLSISTHDKDGKTYTNVELNASDVVFLTPKEKQEDLPKSVQKPLSLDEIPF